jgi:hypothetical protein
MAAADMADDGRIWTPVAYRAMPSTLIVIRLPRGPTAVGSGISVRLWSDRDLADRPRESSSRMVASGGYDRTAIDAMSRSRLTSTGTESSDLRPEGMGPLDPSPPRGFGCDP